RGVGDVHAVNIARWDGSQWSSLGGPEAEGLSAYARAIASEGTNTYVGGEFEFAGPVKAHHVARWDGSQWHSMGEGLDGIVTRMAALASGSVFALHTSANGRTVTNISRWTGERWVDATAGVPGTFTTVTAQGDQLLLARSETYT